LKVFVKEDVPVFEEGEEDVAIVCSPSVYPFPGKGDREGTIDGDCRWGTSHEEWGIPLRCGVDEIVEMFGEQWSDE
jgi:hypothetical protein